MRLSELKSAGRTPDLPLTLALADAAGPGQLQLLSLLRVLPGERYVGAGVWRGRPVLAKLLVGSKAARHFQRELSGVRLLAEQGLTTPLLLADGLQEGEGGWLLFEFIEGAESLADAWQAVEGLPPLADEQTAVLAEALGAIAQMHTKGLWQEDLHLDNLLRQDGKLYLIDGAGIAPKRRASRCRATVCWKTSGCFSPNCQKISRRSPKSCWFTTCLPMASTPCRWKPWRNRCAKSAPGVSGTS